MTINTTANTVVGYGNGSTTVWPFSFPVQNASDLTVIVTDASGNVSTIPSSQYSVTSLPATSGSITYPTSGSPLATGSTLTIVRTVPYTQTTDLTNQGGFYPDVIEAALDKLTMEAQQLATGVSYSIAAPTSDDVTLNRMLPVASARANKYLAFDSLGNVVVASGTSSTAPTAATVVTTFTPTVGQTTFTPNGGYQVGCLDVYLNGVLLAGSDYTATNGTTFTLTTGALAVTDVVSCRAWQPIATFNPAAQSTLLVSGTGGLGYTTGSGGAVTQLTSRTTGVTLNKTNGQITLASATTTAGQTTTFTVTNSQVAAGDTIVVTQQTGAGIYFFSTKAQAGSFNLSVYTPAAVGVAEAPVLNFAVIKAVAA